MSRIYGIDKGQLKNKNNIDNLSEIDLFFKIDSYINYIIKLRDNNYDVTEEFYALEYLIYQTTKYGVILDIPKENEYIVPNESFIDWYLYYKKYINNLSSDDYNNMKLNRFNNKNINTYLPNKYYNENKETSINIEIKLRKGI